MLAALGTGCSSHLFQSLPPESSSIGEVLAKNPTGRAETLGRRRQPRVPLVPSCVASSLRLSGAMLSRLVT
jgi:hypothetical protein